LITRDRDRRAFLRKCGVSLRGGFKGFFRKCSSVTNNYQSAVSFSWAGFSSTVNPGGTWSDIIVSNSELGVEIHSSASMTIDSDDATITAHYWSPYFSNSPPIAESDSAVTAVNVPMVVDVLANDSDPDGDDLIVTSAGSAEHGTVVVNADNTVTYTPNTGFEGNDTFQYFISDRLGGTSSNWEYIWVGQPQLLSGEARPPEPGASILTVGRLRPVVDEAIAQLRLAGFDVSNLREATFQITQLHSQLLGVTYQKTIWIDQDAAGHGWYIGEVTSTTPRSAASTAGSLVDLLTVVTHELGHILGFDSISPSMLDHNWMTATLPAGTRRLPDLAPLLTNSPPVPVAVIPETSSQPGFAPIFAKQLSLGSLAKLSPLSVSMRPWELDGYDLSPLWSLPEDDLSLALDKSGKSLIALLEQKPNLESDSATSDFASSEFDLAEPKPLGDSVGVLVGGAGNDMVIGNGEQSCLVGGF
jgi:hypothetical protein